jgi:hypothetical protein
MSHQPTDRPTKAEQLTLNFTASAGVTVTTLASGEVRLKPGKIIAQGSVRQAARILGVPMMTIYRLIEDGDIDAWKPRNTAANCKYVVNMTSVYDLRRKRDAAGES